MKSVRKRRENHNGIKLFGLISAVSHTPLKNVSFPHTFYYIRGLYAGYRKGRSVSHAWLSLCLSFGGGKIETLTYVVYQFFPPLITVFVHSEIF